MNSPSLSLFFPVYNESANLPALVEECVRFVEGYSGNAEVIFVNDGSVDDTSAIIAVFCARYPYLRLVNHVSNRGYGAAIQSGFRACRNELVFFSDGDNQFRLHHLGDHIRYIQEGADVVIGYRRQRQDSVVRKVNAFAWRLLVTALFGFRVRDIDCAYKLFRKEVVESLNLSSTGALISTEMLAKVFCAGKRVTELPVDHFPRTAGRQTGASPRVIAWAFWELLKLYRKIRPSSELPNVPIVSVSRCDRERAHFDREAERETVFLGNESFDYLNHPCIPENRFLLESIQSNLRNARVLDIGCGVGEAAICFAKRGAEVCAVDVSSKALEVARAKAGEEGVHIDFRCVDDYNLPFDSRSFDLVYGNGVLHHLDLRRSASEIERVLKRGGVGFFIEPTNGNPLISFYRLLARNKRSMDEHPLTKEDHDLLLSFFPRLRVVPFQVATLMAFLKMFFLEWKDPRRYSYWRQPILYPAKYRRIYTTGVWLDQKLRRYFPSLFSTLCWNEVIVLKAADA